MCLSFKKTILHPDMHLSFKKSSSLKKKTDRNIDSCTGSCGKRERAREEEREREREKRERAREEERER
jgi:hypothetical protein